MDVASREWLRTLRGDGATRDEALARLARYAGPTSFPRSANLELVLAGAEAEADDAAREVPVGLLV
jgi:hypothetical protein